MVGALLGMLTVIVISQMLINSEERRRNVAMGGDADINGSLALFTLQRDIQMAGYGMGTTDMMGCKMVAYYNSKRVIPDEDDPHAQDFILAPVIIDNGVDDAPDTITVVRGETVSSSVPMRLKDATSDKPDRFVVEATLGVRAGDQFISVPQPLNDSTPCQVFEATNNVAAADTTLSSTNLPHTNTSKWNTETTPHSQPTFLVNLGRLAQRQYFLTTSAPFTLRSRNLSSINGTFSFEDLYPEIVNMQALYGKDVDGNGTVDRYDHTTPTTSAGWASVVSIRIALVARSNQYDKDEVTSAEPQWDLGSAVSVFDETTVDCGDNSKCMTLKIDQVPDWKHFRYKIYTTTIPLRNVLWTK